MKALLRINYYIIENAIKWTLIASCVLVAVCTFGPKLLGLSDDLMIFVSYSANYGIMGIFAGLSYTLLFNNSKSKWDKFELSAPVSRKDVIKSRYLSFLGYALLAIILASLAFAGSYLFGGMFNLDRLSMGYTVGIILLLGVPAFLHPLVLVLGIDKGQFLFLVATGLSLAILFVPSLVLGAVSGVVDVTDPLFATVIYRGIAIAIVVVLFVVSYYLSVSIYSKKDL